MGKKSGTARAGTQRHKTRAQKSFEVVRPEGDQLETEAEETQEEPTATHSVSTLTTTSTAEQVKEEEEEEANPAPKGSAAARVAARRRAIQKAQQRNANALLTPEHFLYVKKDLITIGILSVILFTAIIVLYFTIGRA